MRPINFICLTALCALVLSPYVSARKKYAGSRCLQDSDCSRGSCLRTGTKKTCCTTAGHCLGDSCANSKECDGRLICRNKACAIPRHAKCKIDSDCKPKSICRDGYCLKTFGKGSFITYFNDDATQCYFSDIPKDQGILIAVNPSQLGISNHTWNKELWDVSPSPWCFQKLNITVKGDCGKGVQVHTSFIGTIADTCDPTGKDAPPCDYSTLIDMYGDKTWPADISGWLYMKEKLHCPGKEPFFDVTLPGNSVTWEVVS